MAENEQKVEEKSSQSEWKKKFLASRAALEQILFERELVKKKEPKNYRGLIGLSLILLAGLSLLFYNWNLAQGALSAASISKLALAEKFMISLSGGFSEFFFKARLFDLNFDLPFYYLSYFPVLKYLTSDKALAVFLVNAFYYCVFVCSIYFSVNIRGNYKSALMAALLGAFFPFWFTAVPEFSVSTATCALTALTYLFFIKSEDMENPVWVFPMALTFAIGLITDKMYIFYVLPLIHWLNWGFAGLYQGKIFKAMLIAFIIGVPFYLRILVKFLFFFIFRGQQLFDHFNFNLFWYMHGFADASNLLFFIIGLISILWMKYALFELYEKRTIIWKWFISSYIVLWLFPIKDASYVYPALAPLAIASGIMIPDLLRKYFMAGVLVLSFFNQSGFVPSVSVPFFKGKAVVLGMKMPAAKSEKIGEVLRIVKENLPYEGASVAVFGNSPYINSATLSLLSARHGMSSSNFKNYPPAFVLFSDIAVLKGSDTASKMPPYFKAFFREIISFNDGDISVYAKVLPAENQISDEGSKYSKQLEFFGFTLKNAQFSLGSYDAQRKIYSSGELILPYANLAEMDFYNTRLLFKDLCLARDGERDLICGFSSVEIKSLKTTDFSFSRFVEERLKNLMDLEIKSESVGRAGFFTIYGRFRKKEVEVPVMVYSDGNSIYIKVLKIEYAGLRVVPNFLARFLTFEITPEDMVVPVKFKKIQFNEAMMTVS